MIFCPICSTSGHRLNATPSRNDIIGEGGRGKSSRAKAEDDKVKPLLGFVVYCRLNYKKHITLKSMRLGTCYSKGNIIECDCYFTISLFPLRTWISNGQSQFEIEIF